MNKIITFFVAFLYVFLCSTTFSGCAQPDLYSVVSELRKDVFMGESENYSVVVYSGTKEDPALFDGIVNPTNLSLVFKVSYKEEKGDQLTVKFKIDGKEYSKGLSFSPVLSTMTTQIEVDSLPENNLDVEVICKDKSEVVLTSSQLKKGTVPYTTALENAGKKAKDFLKSKTRNGILKCEIIVRLICENQRNYYYIGFVDKEGLKQAYLVDGKTGEIIAERITSTYL